MKRSAAIGPGPFSFRGWIGLLRMDLKARIGRRDPSGPAPSSANEAVFATGRSSKYLTKSQGGGFFELDSLDQRLIPVAEKAQLGERYTQDLKCPGSIPRIA